ncbi:hypothetical protein [uncultured Sunxiuqinia sp.]|uniref:hypothetical protein n=1 Tax=uncultured Sunxiuqinia sp. TaxID=1573825 RepID=UPI002603C374|nr:hypothetical protein [uncultured Sunxiuqinia sp.]
MFDPINYMQTIHSKMKLTKDKYRFCKVSGVGSLEEVLENSRREKHFFAIDDSQDGQTFRKGGGYFERRPYTVFILGRAEYGKMDQREAVLTEAKSVYRHILSKLIRDKLTIPVLNMENINFYEVPPAFATGCSGLYFVFFVENPVNLVYDAAAWND